MTQPISNRMDTIFVHVTDLNHSIRWYASLLGQQIEEKEYQGPVFTFNMGEGRPGLTLDDHRFDDGYDFKPSNQAIFNLSADDINNAYEHVKGLGADFVTGILTCPDLSEFSFKDPDGNIIMICTCFT